MVKEISNSAYVMFFSLLNLLSTRGCGGLRVVVNVQEEPRTRSGS